MLDQLRAMGVFACVVEKNSFSGAARELGITTSAVSQQIRSLEQDMEVVLLNRSTRKLSLTEAGQAFFHSCQEMLSAAERGKVRINELRDDLVGELRIVSLPEVCANHVIPALSHWMSAHRGLTVHLETNNHEVDLLEGRIDIALRFDQNDDDHNLQVVPLMQNDDDHNLQVVPLMQIEQILVAAPSYINQTAIISRPEDLKHHDVLPLTHIKNHQNFSFQHVHSTEKVEFELSSRFSTNNSLVAKAMCLQGNGVAKILYLDVKKDLLNGSLIEVLPEWKLPPVTLYAVMPNREQQPTKVLRCLEALKQYFSQISGGRLLQVAS